MKPIQALLRFCLAKQDEMLSSGENGQPFEIRCYVADNLAELAEAFDVEPQTLRETVARTEDARLTRALLLECRRAATKVRTTRVADKGNEAQRNADAVARAAVPDMTGAAFTLSATAVLSCLTTAKDVLTLDAGGYTVDVSMRPLLALRALRRDDLSCDLSRDGLHFHWGDHGHLTFRPLDTKPGGRDYDYRPRQGRVVVCMRVQPVVEACVAEAA